MVGIVVVRRVADVHVHAHFQLLRSVVANIFCFLDVSSLNFSKGSRTVREWMAIIHVREWWLVVGARAESHT